MLNKTRVIPFVIASYKWHKPIKNQTKKPELILRL